MTMRKPSRVTRAELGAMHCGCPSISQHEPKGAMS
jgi:hypothetical protein